MNAAGPEPIVPIRDWTARCSGAFVARRDLRDLLVVEHPWVPSRARARGEWRTTVAAPQGWCAGEPLYVSFYQSDNYSGAHADSAWMGTQCFLGHRFKQLLVGRRVVWEADVADEELAGALEEGWAARPGQPGYHDGYRLVDISPWAAPRLTLTLRVVDRVASTAALPGDAYQRFSWSSCDPADARRRFQTTTFFGDVCLTRQAQPIGPATRSPAAQTAPRGATVAFPQAGLLLPLAVRGPLPAPGYPVRCGVPLPHGCLAAGSALSLRDARGRAVPLAVQETSHWPDGSVRWLLCEFVARRAGPFRLDRAEPATRQRSAPALRVRRQRGAVRVDTDCLSLRLEPSPGPGVFAGLECRGGLSLAAMDLSLKLNRVGWRDHFTAQRRTVVVERANDVVVVLRLDGDLLDAQGQRFGPWRARLHLWAGLPYLLVEWRVVNESDQAMAMVLDWSARVALPDVSGAHVDFGPFTPGYDLDDIGLKAIGHRGQVEDARDLPLFADSEVSCRQERADQARLYRNTSWVATTPQAAGFVHLRHPRGGLTAAMRWFAEEHPKGIVVHPGWLTLATLPESEDAMAWPHDRPLARLGRGEAKQQTFALWLHNGRVASAQAEAFAACVHDAPHLFDAAWFTAAHVIEAGPPRATAALSAWQDRAPTIIERTGIGAPRLGHREYWDTAWSNDYRGRTHLGLIQYFETGDWRWRRYFEAACTHNRDVDIIHFCPEHPEWVGSMHSYGEDHTACGPMGNIGLNCDGLLDHYLATGDPESLAAAAGLAEHIRGCSPWGRSARSVGWPLAQLVRWYEHSGDARFLPTIDAFAQAARTYTEARRGIFDEVHGCWSYRGVVPFMAGYLAFGLMRHHQLTGSSQTLHLLAQTAAGLFAESCTAPGRFRYSPFPENNLTAGGVGRTRAWNALVGGLVGYLHHVTGEAQYAAWARACYDGLVEESDDPQASLDMLTTAGWMLQAIAPGARSG